jgi:carbonic anhydrase
MKSRSIIPFIICFLTIKTYSWDYENGGDDWTGLCKTGNLQSPVDLTDEVVTTTNSNQNYVKIETNLIGEFSSLLVHRTIGNYAMNYALGSILVNSVNVTIFNIHYHSPAESKINGKSYDVELHFMGSDDDSVTYEIAILFEVGDKEDKFIKASIESSTNNENRDFDTEWVFPNGVAENYYYYVGSDSAPLFGDCFEGTVWIVYAKTFEITQEQMDFFDTMWRLNSTFSATQHGNNRNTQPANGRIIYYHTDDDSDSYSTVLCCCLAIMTLANI